MLNAILLLMCQKTKTKQTHWEVKGKHWACLLWLVHKDPGKQKMLICLVSKLLTVYDVCHRSEKHKVLLELGVGVWGGVGGDLVAVYVVDEKPIACGYWYVNSCQYILEKNTYFIVYIFWKVEYFQMRSIMK